MLGDRLAWVLAGRGIPEFDQFAVAAMPAAAMGVLVDRAHWIPGAASVQSSAVITGGLFALLPGRALVAAVQDGLTGFYITASARLLEVVYLVVGIVIGVTLILYAGVHLGADLNPDQAIRAYDHPWVQLVAAMVLTLAFAVLLQCERAVLVLATLNGGVAWTVFASCTSRPAATRSPRPPRPPGWSGCSGSSWPATGTSPWPAQTVTAAIGPLLPGSATYFGLLAFTQNHTDQGFTQLTRAGALALALAIGVNLGNEIARLALPTPGPAAPRRAAKPPAASSRCRATRRGRPRGRARLGPRGRQPRVTAEARASRADWAAVAEGAPWVMKEKARTGPAGGDRHPRDRVRTGQGAGLGADDARARGTLEAGGERAAEGRDGEAGEDRAQFGVGGGRGEGQDGG